MNITDALGFRDGNQNRLVSISISNVVSTNTYSIIVASKLDNIMRQDSIPLVNDGMTLDEKLLFGCCPTNVDSDGDGVRDYAEVYTNNTLPYSRDSDNDGIPDNIDPQPLIPNNCLTFGYSTNLPARWWYTNSPGKPVFSFAPYASHRYFYDKAGNLSMRIANCVTNWYNYSAQNKLTRIMGSGFTNEFLYDSQNRRIGLCHNVEWRYDLHEGMVCIASVVSGSVERVFVRGIGIAEGTGDVLAEIDATGETPVPYFYVANHRGDTVGVLDGNAKWMRRMQYDAFGNQVSSIQYQGSFCPRYTFSTKEYLSDAKLYLYAYRVYDPVAGRWTQRDPVGYHDSLNLFVFCQNNVLSLIDIYGDLAHTYVVDDPTDQGAVQQMKINIVNRKRGYENFESDTYVQSGRIYANVRRFETRDELIKKIAEDEKNDGELVDATIVCHGNCGYLSFGKVRASDGKSLPYDPQHEVSGARDFARFGTTIKGHVRSIYFLSCLLSQPTKGQKGCNACESLHKASGAQVNAALTVVNSETEEGVNDSRQIYK